MSKNRFLVVALAILIALPLVHADSGPYLIPLEGSRWTSSIIHVHVHGGQEWQRNETYEAMQIWNQAQLWFAREYFPNSSVYTFKADDGSAQVQVRLVNSSTIVGSIQAWTDYRAQNGTMESASVQIAVRNSAEAVLLLSLHELGHVLGVGHVSCCERDLMNPYPVTHSAFPVPSTLDLYAVHVLASGDSVPNYVLLPTKVPYQTVTCSELALPEFQNLLLVLVSVLSLMLIRRRQLTG